VGISPVISEFDGYLAEELINEIAVMKKRMGVW
jgi:hypothetical protein